MNLPFKWNQKPTKKYEVWHHGRMIGETYAVSEEQAINNVLYRVGLIGYLSVAEMKSVKAKVIAA